MRRVKVLLVDDSVVIRRMLSDILGSDADIEVIGTASNGKIALQRIAASMPDVVVMDVEMPILDGLQTLKELRPKYPKLPVIMFSTLTTRGGQSTLEALSLGATDYVAKPANVGSVTNSIERIREDLIPKIKALGGMPASSARPPVTGSVAAPGSRLRIPATPSHVRPSTVHQSVEAILVGVSTGGPKALMEVVPRLPANLSVPVLIVQHMPPLFTKLLAERLDSHSAIEVREAADGMPVEPGRVLIAPGDHHMIPVRQGASIVVKLNQEPPENSCRPAVDPLFRAGAHVWGAHTLGFVLTGMGSDGTHGAEAIVAAGGHIVAQDEATSVVWGMPGYVVRAGLADVQLPLGNVADEMLRRVANARPTAGTSGLRGR